MQEILRRGTAELKGFQARSCVTLKDCGRVAQLVEQCPFKAWVAGSSPAALTKTPRHVLDFGTVYSGPPTLKQVKL